MSNVISKTESVPDRQLLQALREARGYSIEDLAETCGLTSGEIASIEDGKDVDAGRLARVIGVLKSVPKR